MFSKLFFLTATFCAAFFLCAVSLSAAEIESPSWYVANGKFYQRLSWQSDQNVFRYNVTIERSDGSIVEQHETSNNSIEISLAPGHYRYIVDVYNLLNVLEYRMPPENFEVLPALQPVVARWKPNKLEAVPGKSELVLTGRNFLKASRIYLSRNLDKSEPIELETSSDGSVARALFSPSELDDGSWTLHVENPGGFTTQVSGIRIGNIQLGIDISGMYAPIVPLRAAGLTSYLFDRAFTNNVYYIGLGAKIAWAPFRYRTLAFGFTLEPFWTNLLSDLVIYEKQYETMSAQLFGTGLSLLFRKSFLNNILSLNGTAGAGVTTLFDVHFQQSGEKVEPTTLPFAQVGAYVKFAPIKTFFIETGLAFCITLPFDNSDLLYLKPHFGMGASL